MQNGRYKQWNFIFKNWVCSISKTIKNFEWSEFILPLHTEAFSHTTQAPVPLKRKTASPWKYTCMGIQPIAFKRFPVPDPGFPLDLK